MEIKLLFISFVFYVPFIDAGLEQPKINGPTSALIYLSRFGYMDPSVTNPKVGSLVAEEAVREAIMEFQAFAGLNQTGYLDEVTQTMMNLPRCGVKDKVGYGSNARKKRYALQGSRWKVRDLNYRITKYPKLLTRAEVNRDIDNAFKVWAEVTELTFTRVTSGKVHIEIRFEKGEHGDGDPFDGVGGTLAHAYFPIYGGDAHFDDSEVWTIDSYRGTNLFQVAAHEFGHSLGLSHSDVKSALMAPFYRGYVREFKLDFDDITAIQALYGKKETKKPKPKAPKKPSPSFPSKPSAPESALCKGPIDAIVTLADKKTYVFKGPYYFKLTDDGVEVGYPKKISSYFDSLPTDLDAAFTWTNNRTYFFKGNKYWRMSGMAMDEGYPKYISSGFRGIPDNVDAAFTWSGNGKIYFFKGTNYWKFDPDQRPPVAEKYPKDVAIWEGLPYYIDDALQYANGYTYFFKNGNYWRFNDRGFRVDTSDPPYPRDAAKWWFGCPDKGYHQAPSTEKPSSDDSFYLGDIDDIFGSESSLYEDPILGLATHSDYQSGNSAATIECFFTSYSFLLVPFILKWIFK